MKRSHFPYLINSCLSTALSRRKNSIEKEEKSEQKQPPRSNRAARWSNFLPRSRGPHFFLPRCLRASFAAPLRQAVPSSDPPFFLPACCIGGNGRPQNRYLTELLNEFERCSQASNDLHKLQKEHTHTRRELTEAIRGLKEMKAERDIQNEKIDALQVNTFSVKKIVGL